MSTASRSAADMLEVGCPEPADVLARIESTLSCWPSSRSSSRVTSAADSTAWSPLMLHLISPSDGWVSRFPARPMVWCKSTQPSHSAHHSGRLVGQLPGYPYACTTNISACIFGRRAEPAARLADLDRKVRWSAQVNAA